MSQDTTSPPFHPVKPHVAYEVINNILLFPILFPDDVSGFQIVHGGSIPVEPMQGKLIYGIAVACRSGFFNFLYFV